MSIQLFPGSEDIPEGATVEWIDINDDPPAPPEPAPMDAAAAQMREWIAQHLPDVATPLLTKRQARAAVKRHEKAIEQALPAAVVPTAPATHQVTVEDLAATWQFVAPPEHVTFDVFEKILFKENHILGSITNRIANAVTKRGTQIALYEEEADVPDGEVPDTGPTAPDPEEAALEAWRTALFSQGWKLALKTTTAQYQACGNAYWEIIRDAYGAEGKPISADWMIVSTMRVMHGHIGFVQQVGGKFIYYNRYEPDPDKRAEGIRLYEEYWTQRSIDPYSEDFKQSVWASTLSSTMPAGVFNPNLTEVVHFRDISLDSKYYGFPPHYRLQKLHALLQSALDWNIAVQRSGGPPYVLVFYGQMTNDDKTAIKDRIREHRGANGAGKVPVINAPPMNTATNVGGVPKSGLELVQIGTNNTEAVFLALVEMTLNHIALHERYPIDMLVTTNSNRATAMAAESWVNSEVVDDLHEMFEEVLSELSRDAGFSTRYIEFVGMDAEDRLAEAQIHDIYVKNGTLTTNEVRKTIGETPTDTGDVPARVGRWVTDPQMIAGESAVSPTPATLNPGDATALTTAEAAVGQAAPDAVKRAQDEYAAVLDDWFAKQTGVTV